MKKSYEKPREDKWCPSYAGYQANSTKERLLKGIRSSIPPDKQMIAKPPRRLGDMETL